MVKLKKVKTKTQRILFFICLFFSTRAQAIIPLIIYEGAIVGAQALVVLGALTAKQVNEMSTKLNSQNSQAVSNNFLDYTISILERAKIGPSPKVCQHASKNSNVKGDCDPELRSSPYSCCKDFMSEFETHGTTLNPIGKYTYRVHYVDKMGKLIECCYEWDDMHGRFEVYSDNQGPHQLKVKEGSNKGADYTHHGERSCISMSESDQDLCTADHPEKADNATAHHSPRRGCP